MSLYLQYRPDSLQSVVGNETIIASIEGMLSKPKTCPHVFLLHGSSGCGKTTIGRILAKRLGCVGADLREIDSADFRGIDIIREIRKNSQFKPLQGDVRVWLMDECFAKGTLIETPDGKVPIELLRKNNIIYSLYGKDTIKSIFINKIALERVIKLKFINGSILYCSVDHLFFTKKGWVKAKKLNKNTLLLPFDGQFMTTLNTQNNDTNKEMFDLREQDSLLPQLARKIQCSILQQCLCRCLQWKDKYRNRTFQRNKEENIKRKDEVFDGNEGRFSNQTTLFSSNENKQSVNEPSYFREGEGNEKDKWHSPCLERSSWWERIFNSTSKIVSNSVRMVYGSRDKNRASSIRSIRISNKLQSGYRESEIKTSNRSGWDCTQIERTYVNGCEENKEIEYIRLESSTIYKQGNNDQSFQSVITDQERNQGYVNFYDLEVSNHPSYFAEGVAVHNCHKITNDAQNALLKILEDTPSHVYFILCTTEPQKLIATIRGRCIEMQVKPLTDIQMKGLLRGIVRSEGDKLDPEIYAQIIQDSQGHPRNAIQILEQVLNVDEDKRLEVAKKTAEIQSQSIELCRIMLKKGTQWKEAYTILVGLKEQEPEDIRRVVMGYCSAVLMKADNTRAAMVLECFLEPFYNSGFPGLVFATYQVIKN